MLSQVLVIFTSVMFAAAFWFTLSLLLRLIALYRSCYDKAADYCEISYKHAQELIKDETVPEVVIDFVEKFFPHVGHPELARLFSRDEMFEKVLRLLGRKPKSPFTDSRLGPVLAELSDKQKNSLLRLALYGMASSAAADPIFCAGHLDTVLRIFEPEGQAPKKKPTAEVVNMSSEKARRAATFVYEHYGIIGGDQGRSPVAI